MSRICTDPQLRIHAKAQIHNTAFAVLRTFTFVTLTFTQLRNCDSSQICIDAVSQLLIQRAFR